jgi:hypothetical protein
VPLIDACDLTGSLSYGHFVVQVSPAPYILDAAPLLREAHESGQQAAGDGWQLLVLAPYEHGYPVALRFEVWDGEAPDDMDGWPEAVEGGLTVEPGSHLVYDSPTTTPVACPVSAGRYRVLVTGRASPGDAAWRIRLWPSADAAPTRRLRSADPQWTPVEPPEPAVAESIVDSRSWDRAAPHGAAGHQPWRGALPTGRNGRAATTGHPPARAGGGREAAGRCWGSARTGRSYGPSSVLSAGDVRYLVFPCR